MNKALALQQNKIFSSYGGVGSMIDTIEERDNQIRYFSGGGMETVGLLGQYSTEEKAIKVLDMIQKRYSEFCCNQFCSVFEMPQDSEV